jgi:UDP-glucuronate 4-epimerase
VRALVTGAAGFIGSHLCQRLLNDGHDVIAVDRMTDYYDVRIKEENAAALCQYPRAVFLREDAGSTRVIAQLTEVDTVFHLAAQPGVRRSWEGFSLYLHENVECVHRLLDAASRLAKAPRIVLASSSSVYGDAVRYPCTEDSPLAPVSPYGVSKLSMEHLAYAYVAAFRLDAVSLRYFTVYGPRQRPDMAFHRFIEAALADEPLPVFGSGDQVRDFTYVDDVVEATLRAGERALPAGTIMNVCGGVPTTVRDVVALLGDLLGRPLRVDHRSPATGDVFRTGGSAERARALLDWRPDTRLDDGLARQLEWHLARGSGREPPPGGVVL